MRNPGAQISLTEEAIRSCRPATAASRDEVEIVYTPQGALRNGTSGWRIMIEELGASRRLIWLLICRDIAVRYRQSILGYLWAVVPQIATVGAFAFLHAAKVLPMGETKIPYVAYTVWGISVWQFFAASLSGCTSSLASSGSLVTKVNCQREALVIAALGQPSFDFLLRLMPVVAVFVWYGISPAWTIVFVPFVLLAILFLALGLGFVLSITNLVIRDTGNALGTMLTLGMFLTPVLYPAPVRWPYALVNFLNPLSPLLTASHDLIVVGSLTSPGMFAIAWIFSLLLALAGWRAFRITIPRVAAYA